MDFMNQDQVNQFMKEILPFCTEHNADMVGRLQDPSWLEDSLKDAIEASLAAYYEQRGFGGTEA